MLRFSKLASAMLLSATCGCSSLAENFSAINPFDAPYVTANARNPAIEVACVWQPGEGRNGKGLPARGFSGQIYFFTRRNAEPVIVDGEVRIYLFADRGTPEENAKPVQQFDFEPAAWAAHATMTSLGPGYSVFIPYPGAEPYQVRCQLRARFTPKSGQPIWSESITMTLDGPPRPGNEPVSWSTPEVQRLTGTVNQINVTQRSGTPAQLDGRESAISGPSRRLRTDTIPLGVLQQIAYEVPAQAAETPRPETTRVDRPKNTVPLEQALAGLTLEEAMDTLHPLRPGERPASGKTHPLDTLRTATRRTDSRAISDHPLDNVSPLASSIPFRNNGMRPSYPNLSSPQLKASRNRPQHATVMAESNAEHESTRQDVSLPPVTQPPVDYAPARRAPQHTATPTYGEWQAIEE